MWQTQGLVYAHDVNSFVQHDINPHKMLCTFFKRMRSANTMPNMTQIFVKGNSLEICGNVIDFLEINFKIHTIFFNEKWNCSLLQISATYY